MSIADEKPIKIKLEEEIIIDYDENEMIEEEDISDEINEFVDYETIATQQYYGMPLNNGPSTSPSFDQSVLPTGSPKKITINSNELAEHFNEDPQDSELHKCNHCFLAFSTLDLAQRHMKKHEAETNKTDKNHQNTNTNKCHLCPEIFKYNKDLLEHLKKIHADEDITLYQCNQCSKTFTSEKKRAKHIYMSHTHRVKNNLVCSFCGKTFCKKQMHLEHENNHKGIVNYKCDVCAKEFIHKANFERHKLYHAEDRKFVCDQCPKSYKTFGHLTIHKRIHTGERPIACPMCDKRFIDSSAMLNHKKRVHKIQTMENIDNLNKD